MTGRYATRPYGADPGRPNVLAAARAELAQALTATGLHAIDHEPSRVTPPVALVAAMAPYLSEADPPQVGRYRLRLRVRLVARAGDADQATDELDQLLVDAIPTIESIDRDGPEGWAVVEVGEHYTLVANQAAYPAVDLTTETTISL